MLAFYGLSELEPTDWAETTIAVAMPGTPGLQGAAAPASAAADAAADDTETDRADLLGLFQARRGTTGEPGSAKVDPATEQFDPELYLAQYYGAVSFAQLESGMRNLHDKVDQRTESLRALVRNNLDRFMKSKDTIDHIRLAHTRLVDWRGRGKGQGGGREKSGGRVRERALRSHAARVARSNPAGVLNNGLLNHGAQFYSGLRARQLLGDAEGSEELRVALTGACRRAAPADVHAT